MALTLDHLLTCFGALLVVSWTACLAVKAGWFSRRTFSFSDEAGDIDLADDGVPLL